MLCRVSEWARKARIIQVERYAWLAVVDGPLTPRYLIRYGPAVHQTTHETHMLYQVLWWTLDKADRATVAWYDTYLEAETYVREEIERPVFNAPIVGEHRSTAITVEEQKARWDAGLDPRTGRPRS